MKLIGKPDTIQNLNLRDGDWVVCVDEIASKHFIAGLVYKFVGRCGGNRAGVVVDGSPVPFFSTSSTFQRLHHHDPRCFGFQEKTVGGGDVAIYEETASVLEAFLGSVADGCGRTGSEFQHWSRHGYNSRGSVFTDDYDLIPITPPTAFEVLGQRFDTRAEAEAAMVIKEVIR